MAGSSDARAFWAQRAVRSSDGFDIRMSAAGLDDDGCLAWCAWAKETFSRLPPHERTFPQMDFSKNQIGDKGCRGLAQLIHELKAGVRVLKLQSNLLGRASAFAIASLIRNLRQPIAELHLSHNCIDKEGAHELFMAIAVAVNGQSAAYPLVYKRSYNSQSPKQFPLWLRLELNNIEGGASCVRAAERDARQTREKAGLLPHGSAAPLFCLVEDKLRNCKPSCCDFQCPEGPIAHVCYMNNSRWPMKVPREASVQVRDGWHLSGLGAEPQEPANLVRSLSGLRSVPETVPEVPRPVPEGPSEEERLLKKELRRLRDALDLAERRQGGEKLDKLQIEKADRVAEIAAEARRLARLLDTEPENLAAMEATVKSLGHADSQSSSKKDEDGFWEEVPCYRKAKSWSQAGSKKAEAPPRHANSHLLLLDDESENEEADLMKLPARELHKARRKLQEIDKLEQKQNQGDKLDAEQVIKLSKRNSVEAEIRALNTSGAAPAQEDAQVSAPTPCRNGARDPESGGHCAAGQPQRDSASPFSPCKSIVFELLKYRNIPGNDVPSIWALEDRNARSHYLEGKRTQKMAKKCPPSPQEQDLPAGFALEGQGMPRPVDLPAVSPRAAEAAPLPASKFSWIPRPSGYESSSTPSRQAPKFPPPSCKPNEAEQLAPSFLSLSRCCKAAPMLPPKPVMPPPPLPLPEQPLLLEAEAPGSTPSCLPPLAEVAATVPPCSPSAAEAECLQPSGRLGPFDLVESATRARGKLTVPLWGIALESQEVQPAGYLQLVAGYALQIQFIGAEGTADEGHCFGKMLSTKFEPMGDGWFPCSLVAVMPDTPRPRAAAHNRFAQPEALTQDRGALQPPVLGLVVEHSSQGAGYLAVRSGDLVQIHFIGCEGSEDEGYCFCKAPGGAAQGWLVSTAILSLSFRS
mmetsp:Transcript_96157/g.170668  ORF Transcript_96157/g.170668 Transcript_96157/m.170668 type:complete len:918 (-) Transcript_96157:110-2863(-)